MSFVGLLVDWMTNASTPRTFSPISTKLSPSLKRVTLHLPSGVSRYCPMAAASSGFALPEKRQTFLNTREPPRENRHESAGHHLPAALRTVNGSASLPRRLLEGPHQQRDVNRRRRRLRRPAAGGAGSRPAKAGATSLCGGHRHLGRGAPRGSSSPRRNGRLDERRKAQSDRDAHDPDDVPREVRSAARHVRRHLSYEPRIAELELVGEPGLRRRLHRRSARRDCPRGGRRVLARLGFALRLALRHRMRSAPRRRSSDGGVGGAWTADRARWLVMLDSGGGARRSADSALELDVGRPRPADRPRSIRPARLEAASVSIDTPTGDAPRTEGSRGFRREQTAATLTAGACVFFDRPRRPFLLMTLAFSLSLCSRGKLPASRAARARYQGPRDTSRRKSMGESRGSSHPFQVEIDGNCSVGTDRDSSTLSNA